MNILRGNIVGIEYNGNLIIVEACISKGSNLKVIVLGDSNTDKYLWQNNTIELLFNESEVILGKGTKGWLSVTNKLDCTLKHVDYGKFFSRMQFDISGQCFYALVPTESLDNADITTGEQYEVMIKINDIFLKQSN